MFAPLFPLAVGGTQNEEPGGQGAQEEKEVSQSGMRAAAKARKEWKLKILTLAVSLRLGEALSYSCLIIPSYRNLRG